MKTQMVGRPPGRLVRTTQCSRLGHPKTAKPRRGSIYILTLSTALIVAVLAMAGVTAVRIQRRQISDGNDLRQAQSYARAAIDMAFYRVQNDSTWRQKLANNTWATDQPIGQGFYSFTGSDPLDGDLADSTVDPVLIVATGKCGSATQILQAQIDSLQPGIRCLEPSLHADHNLVFDGVTITAARMVSANHDVEVRNNGSVYADVEAANSVRSDSGGTYYGSTTTVGTWPRQMPDASTLYDYYAFNGTSINYADLPNWDRNLVQNPGMESSPSSWNAISCSIVRSSSVMKSGSWSMLVFIRDSASDTLAQNVTTQLQSGFTYFSEAEVRTAVGTSKFRLVLRLVSTGSGTQTVPLTDWTEVGNSWKTLSGSAAVSWTGTLTQAQWLLETNDSLTWFYVDDVLLKDAAAASGYKVIQRQVLSPASNPFGTGVTNANGIYVLDCRGNRLMICDSRIVGTVVLLNQNEEDSRIQGSMVWSPAVISTDPRVTNLPTILTNKNLNLASSSAALDEGLVNANLNPTGTPYRGSSNSNRSDVYASRIEGLIYTEKTLKIGGAVTVEGVLVAHEDISVKPTTLDIRYNPLYFELNAPPGFRAAPTYYLVPGSIQPVVN